MRSVLLCLSCLMCCSMSLAEERMPLVLETKVPLGDVKGRIDHLAIDVDGQRLYVAALGNNSVEVVDLSARKVARSLTGLEEPQGIAYVSRTQMLYVAGGGDGSVHVFRGLDLTPVTSVKLGKDADNIRIDRERQQLYVGYGGGALAVIDQATHRKVADLPLRAHPESFQLENAGARIFVNVPDANEIAVVDRRTNRQVASWPTKDLHANYPMALDEANQRVLSVFRRPATLAIFSLPDGALLNRIAICGDADDIFVDAKRALVYVSCGEGFVDVLSSRDNAYSRIARVKTTAGARTALFSAEMDRLFLAARAGSDGPAAIWVFRPSE
jgi:YVTN family beta-propeller protein